MLKLLKNQRPNLFLWVGLVMAMGAALYFTIAHQPDIPYAGFLTMALFAIMIWKRVPIILRAICTFLFGFIYAYVYTDVIDTPQIKSLMRDTEITGDVYKIDFANDKSRIYIKTDSDMKIRVSMGDDLMPMNIGDKISATVTLFHPAAAYAPATFDYAR